MIVSEQVWLVIATVIIISPSFISATKARQKHAACPPFPHITLDHGKITPIGEQKFLFRCDRGYFLTSPPQVRCWRGNWSSTRQPRCLKAEGHCDDPDPLTGGEILGEERHEGSIIQYMCKPGFVLMGEGMRTCLRGRHWSGITPTCMEESESIQNVAERLKEKFLTDMGSHSSDMPWYPNKETKSPSSPAHVNPEFPTQPSLVTNTSADIDGDSLKLETVDDYDMSPITVEIPPNDPHFVRKHKRRHDSKRGKLFFEPSLGTIAEDIAGEEAEEMFSGDAGSGDENSLTIDNVPCYKNPSIRNDKEPKNSFKSRERLPSRKEAGSVKKVLGRRRSRKLSNNNKSRKTHRAPSYGRSTRGKEASTRRKSSKQRQLTVAAKMTKNVNSNIS